jgi:hypothetical protein
MAKGYDPKTCDLSFTKGTIYKDMRKLGGNAYRDVKMSLSLGTSSDLVHYLKKSSKLLKGFEGNEIVEPLAVGMFSYVYILQNDKGDEIVVKRSHDGWVPGQLSRTFFVPMPRLFVKLFFHDYDITPRSLERDVYDYEKILRPFWGKKRDKLEGRNFKPYLNMALHMVDRFLPDFSVDDLYSKKFWKKMLGKKTHKNLATLQKYLRSVHTPKLLMPEEERYVFYDAFSNSLQTIFIQRAVRGKKDIIPGKKMAYPYEMIAAGVVPKEMPKLMIEHILRSMECFVKQLDYKEELPKVPDFRPVDGWKVFPPTPYEVYFAETGNLVACFTGEGKLSLCYVDTHVLHEPEGDTTYRWLERRCWISMFLNLRFWIRKALDSEPFESSRQARSTQDKQ